MIKYFFKFFKRLCASCFSFTCLSASAFAKFCLPCFRFGFSSALPVLLPFLQIPYYVPSQKFLDKRLCYYTNVLIPQFSKLRVYNYRQLGGELWSSGLSIQYLKLQPLKSPAFTASYTSVPCAVSLAKENPHQYHLQVHSLYPCLIPVCKRYCIIFHCGCTIKLCLVIQHL